MLKSVFTCAISHRTDLFKYDAEEFARQLTVIDYRDYMQKITVRCVMLIKFRIPLSSLLNWFSLCVFIHLTISSGFFVCGMSLNHMINHLCAAKGAFGSGMDEIRPQGGSSERVPNDTAVRKL